MRVYRHGDVIFREVKELPKGEVKELGTTFQQHGETGKLHTLTGVKVVEVDWDGLLQTLVTTPKEGGVVTHPEHPPLVLPPSTTFVVEKVRSVTPYVD